MTSPSKQAPPRPVWVEDINSIGRSVGGSSRLISLDRDALLGAATEETGLDDFGDETWRDGFERLVKALNEEADLNTLGRLLARSEIVRVLQNRLRIIETFRQHPEIEKEEIRAPIFITGTARSGTSILHELMAQDPAHRTPQTWEVNYSTPPPESATYETDARIESADREVTFWHEISPDYLSMHENGGSLPLECIFLMAHAFMSDHWSGVHNVPSYAAWLALEADIRPAFRFHRKMLQLLQWKCKRARWMLKAPSHLRVLPALFDVYPDARIALTHRDPAKTVASSISLVSTLRGMRSDHVDVESIAQQYAGGMAHGLEKVMQEREAGILPDDRFADIGFADLMRDPGATLSTLYKNLGEDLPEETLRKMVAYSRAKPRGKHGAHSYSLEDYGIKEAWIRERYDAYMDCYKVERENSK